MNSYKELIVWQKSIKLVTEIYKVTGKFPKYELYGIVSQIRRAAISIPSNIAEGYSRQHRREYTQFVAMAFSSGAELETQILISKKLRFIPESEFEMADNYLDEVMRMLNRLIRALKSK